MLIDGILASPGYSLLKLALDAANLRHQTIASNIANVDTEGYQPLKVSFEDQLQQEARSQNAKPRIEADTASNSVSLDKEMINMNKNFIHYQALIKAVNGKIELTNLALNDGRR